MKKFVAVALSAALVGAPAFADDASFNTSGSKPSFTAMSEHKPAMSVDEGDAASRMSGHREYEMMGEYNVAMMMESNIRMLAALPLSKEQKSAINKISDEFNHNIWFIQGLINDETAKLSYLYEADRRDPAAIGKEYMKVFDLKRQLIEAYLETQNRIEDILTPEQRAKMKDSHHEMRHKYGHPLQ